MNNINILKPSITNFQTYLIIGSSLIFLSIFDVILRSFFNLNFLTFLPGILNVFFPLIIGLVGALGFLILGFNKADLPFGSLGFINIPAVLIISLVSILTAPIGVEWAHNLEENKLKRLFGLYLLFVSSGMFWKASLSSSII